MHVSRRSVEVNTIESESIVTHSNNSTIHAYTHTYTHTYTLYIYIYYYIKNKLKYMRINILNILC
jgi:hypothetical protein